MKVLATKRSPPKREQHNATEKQRRMIIRQQFESLRKCLQGNTGKIKLSRSQTLVNARRCIDNMKQSIDSTRRKLETIQEQNKELEEIIRQMNTERNDEKMVIKKENISSSSTQRDREAP